MWKPGAFKLGAKTSLYLLSATGFASATYLSSNSSHSLDLPFDFFNGVVRSSRAIFTITSCAFDYKYSLHGLSTDSDEYWRTLSEIHLRSARRVLKLCDTNKGFYVKAGQFVAAMRQVPKEYSSTLSSLQDQAVPCDFDVIKEVIFKNLGKDLSEIFLSFDERPVAAASIAQVHHALLKNHQEVAVKVQYPGLEYKMKYDIATMAFLSKAVAWLFPQYRFEWLVSEFEKSITSELDGVRNKSQTIALVNTLRNGPSYPFLQWLILNALAGLPLRKDFTSSRVLTMQFCSGKRVDDLEFFKHKGISSLEVAKVLVEVFAEMIFIHGFLHGDPHPGNILVSPQGPDGFSLILLDHGIYKQLDKDFRRSYCHLWEALILLDSQKILQLGEAFGVGKYSRYFPVIFTGRTINSKSAFGRAMSPEEKNNLKQEVKSLKMEDISSFMESLPPDFLTILRTDGLLRSLISKLGAPQRIRLVAYARSALRGLTLEDACSGSVSGTLLMRCMQTIKYLRLRLHIEIMELIAQLNDIRRTLMTRFIQFIASTGDLIWSLYGLPLVPRTAY